MASSPKETTTKTEPWDGAKPYITKYLSKADQLYSSGQPAYYPEDTYADQSQATKDALAQREATARAGTPLFGNAQNVANGVMNGSGVNTQAQNTLSNLQNGVNVGNGSPVSGIASGIANGSQIGLAPGQYDQNYTNAATDQASNQNGYTNAALSGQQAQADTLSTANNPATSMLQRTANGDFLNSNPYLNQAITNANAPLIEQFKTQIAPGIDSKAALAGRTGSGAQAALRNDAESTLANAMAKNASDIAYQNYGQERTNQLNAQNQIGALYNSDVANQMNALNALSGTSNTQQSQRLAGTELYGNLNNSQESMRQSAANNMNTQYNADRANQMQGMGLMNDIYNQAVQNQFQNANLQMNAANSAFGNQNTAANTQLGAAGMAEGLRGLDYYDSDKLGEVGAQQDAWNNLVKQADIARWDYQQNQPFNNIANMLNMANGGGYNNQTTPVYNNTAGQIGGLLTGLLGLFASDIKTKKILSRVGETPTGIPMYQFVYHSDPDQKIYIGPIAQEMQEIKPDSVIEIDGTLYVDPYAFMEETTWH